MTSIIGVTFGDEATPPPVPEVDMAMSYLL